MRRGDQRPRRRRGGESEQYIRLRIRVRNGRLSVVDSHLVDGPLGQVTGFPGSHAYEVTLDGATCTSSQLACRPTQ
jgi:hypothetical protein